VSPPDTRWRHSGILTAFAQYFSVTVAVDEMVDHYADRLHVRVDDRRTHEAEATMLQILAERL
jgi:uncharacterized protein (UPF0332 family)